MSRPTSAIPETIAVVLGAAVSVMTGGIAAAQSSEPAGAAYPPWEYALTGLAIVVFVFVAVVLGGLITGLATASLLEFSRSLLQRTIVTRFLGGYLPDALAERRNVFDLHYTQLCSSLASQVATELRLSTGDGPHGPVLHGPSLDRTALIALAHRLPAYRATYRPNDDRSDGSQIGKDLLDAALQGIEDLQAVLGTWHDRIGFYLSLAVSGGALFGLLFWTGHQMENVRGPQIRNLPTGMVPAGLVLGALAMTVVASLVLKTVERRLGSK